MSTHWAELHRQVCFGESGDDLERVGGVGAIVEKCNAGVVADATT